VLAVSGISTLCRVALQLLVQVHFTLFCGLLCVHCAVTVPRAVLQVAVHEVTSGAVHVQSAKPSHLATGPLSWPG
jgi:hypothetical protein